MSDDAYNTTEQPMFIVEKNGVTIDICDLGNWLAASKKAKIGMLQQMSDRLADGCKITIVSGTKWWAAS